MVLSPPSPDDQPGEGAWLDAIRLELSLASRGILILVDKARPERLRDLVLALLPSYPDLEVYTDVQAVYEVPEGATMVLAPRAEDADFLNINRPVFARRGLKVVLWCDEATTLALARDAVDFFDWISRRHECPPGVPMHAVYGIRAALCARAPGIYWKSGALDACFRAALPGRELIRLDLRRPLEELRRAVRSAGRAWLACYSPELTYEHLFLYELRFSRRWTRVFIVPTNPRYGPEHTGMIVIEGECQDLRSARQTLSAAGSSAPGRLAALTGLEPQAVQIVARSLQRVPEQTFANILGEAYDPGAAVARTVTEYDVLGDPPFNGIPALAIRGSGRRADRQYIFRAMSRSQMEEQLRSAIELATATKWIEDLVLAESLARRAVVLTEPFDSIGYHASTLHALARVLERRGRFTEAEAHIRHALSIKQSLGVADAPELPLLLDDLANVLTRQGRYAEAEAVVLQELDELRRGGPSSLVEQAEQRLTHLRALIARGLGGSGPP